MKTILTAAAFVLAASASNAGIAVPEGIGDPIACQGLSYIARDAMVMRQSGYSQQVAADVIAKNISSIANDMQGSFAKRSNEAFVIASYATFIVQVVYGMSVESDLAAKTMVVSVASTYVYEQCMGYR